mgnify:CR=1 FL=1
MDTSKAINVYIHTKNCQNIYLILTGLILLHYHRTNLIEKLISLTSNKTDPYELVCYRFFNY